MAKVTRHAPKPRRVVTCRMAEHVHAGLEIAAERDRRSVSELIEIACEKWLADTNTPVTPPAPSVKPPRTKP